MSGSAGAASPGRARREGRVWLVGAGPGDPDLITVRGRRALEVADIVLHDRLVSAELLALVPSGSLRIDVGKIGYGRSTPQAEICALLVRFARAGYRVVRLKGGDPFVFGRGGEEALALRDAGVPFEVVPGVSAGVAGPAFAGIPVSHRGLARSVAFVTASVDRHPGDGEPSAARKSAAPGNTAGGRPTERDPVDWDAVARIDTVVVFMAGSKACDVAARLVRAGRNPATPAALVVDASLPGQQVWRGELAGLSARRPDLPAGRPCLLVVGEVVALSTALDWFEPSAAGLGLASPAAVVTPRAEPGWDAPRTARSGPRARVGRTSRAAP